MKKRVLAVLMTTAMVISLLAGCSTPGSKKSDDSKSSDEGGKKRVTYALRAEPPSMDPQLANSIPSSTACIHIAEGLTRNVEGDIRPAGAESWEISEDGMTYTFKLREGMKWSDGQEITVDDYVYGMQRLMDPATASDFAFIGMLIKNAAAVNSGEMAVDQLGVKKIDDKTLEIQLEHPATYFIGMLGMAQFCPARKDIVEKFGKDHSADADKAVYSGPFVMEEWKHGDEILLAKNENYWDADNIKLDQIVIKTVTDAKTAVAMWEQGELDITEVPMEMTEQYADQSEFVFTGANDYLALNMAADRPLANKNLRLAMNYAMNRSEFNTLVNNDVYEPNLRYVLPNVNGVEKTYGEEYPLEAFPLEGDMDQAKEYLNKAVSEMGVADAAAITVELLTTDTENAKKQAEVIQEQLQKALGITVSIKQVTYKQRLELENDRDFDMVSTGWVPDYSDPYSYLELWISDGIYNHSNYNNPEYDKLLEETLTETDAKTRMDELAQAEKIFLEDAAVVPLHLRRNQLLINEKVKDFKTYFVGYDYNLVYADKE